MPFNRSFLFFFYVLFAFTGYSQNFAVGGSAIYNFQTEGFGVGVRANIFPNKRISIVPQFSYFFPFNKVNEYYIGVAGEFKIVQRDRINVYAILHGGYNSWLNYTESPMSDSQPNNWNMESGIGVSNYRCVRPFIEYRYNLRHRETNLQFGFLYVFRCRVKKSTGHCDAYGS